MQIDVLDYLVMADQSKKLPFSRQTHGLAGYNDILTPIDLASGYGQWKRLKSPAGFPWDLKLYDQYGVYDWVTEKSWDAGSRSYKKFVLNHRNQLLAYADGLKMCQRYFTTPFIDSSVYTAKSRTTYKIVTDCVWDGKPNDLGDVSQNFFGPFLIDHGGDVGRQPTLIQHYCWDGVLGAYGMVEENYYALNYGWIRWTETKFNPATGLYEITKNATGGPNITITNTLVKRAPSAVDFPCF